MSTTGQVIGTVVGAVVGFWTGGLSYVALGAAIGGAIGGYIDPPKGPHTIGPRLEDRKVQGYTYGFKLPRFYGTMETAGCVIWVEGDQYVEHKNTKKTGGKGGGSKSTSTTYTYSVTFAVALAQCTERAIIGVRKIRIGTTIFYDAGSNDLDSIIASNLTQALSWKFYDGRDDQEPDPRMQADRGVGNVSGRPGLCYLVIYDLDLTEKFSNTLAAAQVKVELVAEIGAASLSADALMTMDATVNSYDRRVGGMFSDSSSCSYSVIQHDSFYSTAQSVWFYKYVFGEGQSRTASSATGISITTQTVDNYIVDSDRAFCIFQVIPPYPNNDRYNLWFYEPFEAAASSATYYDADMSVYKIKRVAVSGDEWFFASHEGMEITKFINGDWELKSSASYSVGTLALSDSFVFCSKFEAYDAATLTIYKFARSDLSLVDTWTTTYTGKIFALTAVDDTLVCSWVTGGAILAWHNGAYVDNLGVLAQAIANNTTNDCVAWLKAISLYPPCFVFGSDRVAQNYQVYLGHPTFIRQPAKLRDVITSECSLVGLDSTDLNLTSLTNSDVRGYASIGASSVRSALEPLQAAWPFDVTQSGYKVKFISRGGASVVTIPETDLGTREGKSQQESLLVTEREMSEQIASTVTISYLDADRDYETTEQNSYRPGTTSVSERRVELALVMTAEEAAQAADVLLKKEWAERISIGPFTLPPTYSNLEAADIVTIQHRGRSVVAVLTKVNYLPDGRVECYAKATSGAAYTSTAQGSTPLSVPPSVVPLRGTTQAVLLDIPMLLAAQDTPGISAAVYGKASGWPGGVLLRSDDSGQTWGSQTGFLNASEVFTATTALPTGISTLVDAASTLTVTADWSGADLFSITDAQLFNLGNIAAFGADGRWEILAFKTVVDNTVSYTLSDFLRGRFGTEWAMSLHQIGDRLVMLDANNADFIGLPLATINSLRLWRAVTDGDVISSAPDIQHVYAGVNLKPLSPVYLDGSRHPTTFDWSLDWTARSRTPVEPFAGLATPLGESSELWDVEVWNSTYTTMKRTFSSLTAAHLDYTSTQQTSDFSAAQPTLYLKIFQISATVGRGYPLQNSISCVIKTDGTNYSPTVLSLSPLLYYKLDGNTTTVIDAGSAASNATASGSGITYQQSSLLTAATPGFSFLGSGSGGITSPHLAAMNGAYSVVLLVKPTSLAADNGLFHKGNAAVSGQEGHYVRIGTNGKIYVDLFNGTWSLNGTTNAAISVNEQAHFVFVYNGATQYTIYKNGSLFETLTLAAAAINNTTSLSIMCAYYNAGPVISLVGYMDEFTWFTTQLSAAQADQLYKES